jgi:hypothetical protein|tara:strand:+ start:9595 stop:9789 length:195 start_codon:yes stop_codon:yes gene_type:complete
MDIDKLNTIERNNVVLRKTLTYVNGEVKEVVQRQIKRNVIELNDLLEEYEREFNSIESYEQGGA